MAVQGPRAGSCLVTAGISALMARIDSTAVGWLGVAVLLGALALCAVLPTCRLRLKQALGSLSVFSGPCDDHRTGGGR